MDQFYANIYDILIYKWLVVNEKVYKEYRICFHIDHNDPNRLSFEYGDIKGEIYFWRAHHIIEETIMNDKGKVIFYLHFRVVNLVISKRLIIDFFKELVHDQKRKHIGMSCSCGMTSSIFTEKLQKLSDMLNLPYQFDVVPIDAIEVMYLKYDMIILAPQTSYLEPKMKAICQNHCCIMSIDASLFATGNYQLVLSIIQNYFK